MKQRLLALGTAIALCTVAGFMLAELSDMQGWGLAETLADLLDIGPEEIPGLPTHTAARAGASELELELLQTSTGAWRAVLTNQGTLPLILVAPGDGSWEGLRTPTLTWTIEAVDGTEPKPRQRGMYCGNINALRVEEILVVEPGESTAFAISNPPFVDLDQYFVTLRYTNDPKSPWAGAVHRGALEALQRSTVCSVVSNRVYVDRR